MVTEDKSGLLENVKRSVRCKAQKLVVLVAEELSQSDKQARERAHLATCGDRPFVGCNPCQPGGAAILTDSVANPAAVPRPDTRGQ